MSDLNHLQSISDRAIQDAEFNELNFDPNAPAPKTYDEDYLAGFNAYLAANAPEGWIFVATYSDYNYRVTSYRTSSLARR